MIYKCEKCHYLFSVEKPPEDQINEYYRCPDCGNFGVREATEAECKEYIEQQANRDKEEF